MSAFIKIIAKILSANPILLIVALPVVILYSIFKEDE